MRLLALGLVLLMIAQADSFCKGPACRWSS